METRKKTFQSMTIREKAEHIWEYYKPVLLGIVLAAALIIYIIMKIVSPEPESVLNVTLVNAASYNMEEEDVFERYLREQGYDPQKETISVNTGLFLDPDGMSQGSAASYQALVAMTMVGEIDLLGGDQEILELLGANGGLMDMGDILNEEQLERYADRLYTATDAETGTAYVCGIRLPQDNPLTADGYYGENVWAAVPYTAAHQELAKEFLLYLLGE